MDIDWSKLTFSYRPVNCHVEYHYKNGQWDKGEEKTINSVKRYLDPADAPSDGKPIVSGGENAASDEW